MGGRDGVEDIIPVDYWLRPTNHMQKFKTLWTTVIHTAF